MISETTTHKTNMIAYRLLVLFFIIALVIEATVTTMVNGKTVFESNLKVGSKDWSYSGLSVLTD
jgi:hypothetical protein